MTETECAVASTAHLGRLRLRVRGGGLARLVDVTAACCPIGSAPGCTLRLRAPGVRDVHCLIVRGRGISTVRDLAGDTLLNGASFHEAPLAVGDCLRVGPLEIVVEADTHGAGADVDMPPAASPGKELADLIAQRQTAALEPDYSLRHRLSEVATMAVEARQEALGCLEQVAQQAEQWDAGMCAIVDKLNTLERASTAQSDQWQQVSAHQQEAEAAAASRLVEFQSRLHGLEDVKERLADLGARLQSLTSEERVQQLADQLASMRADGEAQRGLHADNSLRFEQMAARLSHVENLADELSRRSPQPLPRDPQEEERFSECTKRLAEIEQTMGRLIQSQDSAPAASRAAQESLNATIQGLVVRVEQLAAGLAESRGRHDTLQGELQVWQTQCVQQEEILHSRLEQVAQEAEKLREDRQAAMDFVATRETETCSSSRGRSVASETHSARAASVLASAESLSAEGEGAAPQPEELSFEPVSAQAPLSTADVFQRLGTTVDFAEEKTLADAAVRHAGQGAATAALPRPAARVSAPADEDQDSIDEYMTRLLGRSRTMPINELKKTEAKTPATNPAKAPESFAHLPPTEPAAPAEPYRPRAVAPELSSDMSAMRALANNTARQAIDRHQRKSQAIATQGHLAVALVALVLSFILMWFSADSATAFWSSMVALIVAMYWGARYVLLTRSLKRVAADEPEPEKKQEASA